jgi:hypothetical protein
MEIAAPKRQYRLECDVLELEAALSTPGGDAYATFDAEAVP